MAVPAVGVFVAILTLSRGALLAAAVGLLVLFWSAGRTVWTRGLFRTAGAVGVLAVVPVMQYLISARSQGGFNPEENVADRFTLFELAWRSFLESPITGTGWLALRDMSADNISFAHNMVVSFLQIAGLFGAAYVVILLVESFRAMRRRPLMGAAVAAALAVSMSDPFFESAIGATVSWAAIMYASRGIASNGKDTESVGDGHEVQPPG